MSISAEFRIVSDQREGLLLAIGEILIDNGFSIRRQRLTPGGVGAMLVVSVDGPRNKILHVQESIANHPLVRAFEMETKQTEAATADRQPRAERRAPAVAVATVAVTADGGAVAVPEEQAAAVAEPTSDPRLLKRDSVEQMRLEALLPKIAASYPAVVSHLRQLQGELEADQVASTMRYVGRRVGAWVYKRDFAFGARLELRDAVRRIVVPALKQLVVVELIDDVLYVTDSSFCEAAGYGSGCHFLAGMIEGVLAGAMGRPSMVVDETRCSGNGDQHCCFVVRP